MLLVREALVAYSCIFIRNADMFDALTMLIKATLMKIRWTRSNEDRHWWWAINNKTTFEEKRICHQNAIIISFFYVCMYFLSYILVFCLLLMIFEIKYCKKYSYFANFARKQYKCSELWSVLLQPLTSTTQLWMARNVKLMNYTAVEKYESTLRLVLLQRIR